MDYKVNSYNLSDLNFTDASNLSKYLAKGQKNQGVINMMIGPNIITLNQIQNNVNEKDGNSNDYDKIENGENKKILSAITRLIVHNMGIHKDQIYTISGENSHGLLNCLYNFISEIDLVFSEKTISTIQEKCKNFLLKSMNTSKEMIKI